MGFVDKLLGQDQRGGAVSEYVELDLEQYEDDMDVPEAEMEIHIAELKGRDGVMDVKDKVYEGDLVIADISYFRTNESKMERIIEEFRKVADEVRGDIVQKGEDQIIVAPRGVRISRDKIGG